MVKFYLIHFVYIINSPKLSSIHVSFLGPQIGVVLKPEIKQIVLVENYTQSSGSTGPDRKQVRYWEWSLSMHQQPQFVISRHLGIS